MSISDPDSQSPREGELPLPALPAAAGEPLVPARMVNEWVYCPRLAYLEWVQGEWAGNADTAAGDAAHKPTKRGRAPALPEPEPVEEGAALKTRRLLLASEALGVTAEIDILEVEDGACTPVDVKAGRRPHVAEGAYLPERVQLCVQGLLLREAGYRSDDGAIWYAASRERVRVAFDEALVAETLRAASDLRLAARGPTYPAASSELAEMPALLASAHMSAGRGELVPPAPGAAHASAARAAGAAPLRSDARRAGHEARRDARRPGRGRGGPRGPARRGF